MFEREQKKILVAVDFSDGADRALAEAVSIAKAFGAAIEIVHVLELATMDSPLGPTFYSFDRGGYLGYANRALEERAKRSRSAGIICKTHTLDGRPASEIVRRAIESGTDLIVIGTHGRTGLAHAMMGSVAERVVRHAGCPVLTVPLGREAA